MSVTIAKPEVIVAIDKAQVFYNLPARASGVLESNVFEIFKNLDIYASTRVRGLMENHPYELHPINYHLLIKQISTAGRHGTIPETYVFVYDRPIKGNGEERLAGLSSVGVGGHVERYDVKYNPNGSINLWETITTTGLRELQEEVKLTKAPLELPVRGFIYDTSNDVGRVHLGVWGVAEVPEDTEILGTEDQLLNGRWENIRDIDTSKFESWSKLLLEHLCPPPKDADREFEDGHDALRHAAEQ